jgi:hypothetical protein
MVPVNARLSFFGVPGGGYVKARSPVVTPGAGPTVSTHDTDHGVFAFGGGVDVRIVQWFGVRAEIRDFVTGRDLSQVTGRQHVAPLFGVALHF